MVKDAPKGSGFVQNLKRILQMNKRTGKKLLQEDKSLRNERLRLLLRDIKFLESLSYMKYLASSKQYSV